MLTGLSSGREVHHRGEHYLADGVTFRPTSARDGWIPIWLAARWPNAVPIRRAAHFGGVVVIQMKDPDDVAVLCQRLIDEGADLEHFDVVVTGFIGDDPRRGQRPASTGSSVGSVRSTWTTTRCTR